MDNSSKLPLLSVIVSVYRVEEYLDRCVDSIVGQTYDNLEIILVDDGSPDRSGEICDKWAAKDGRVKVIHKENGGGAAARNTGMYVMTGDIVAFVDSDDYIAPGMYEYLFNLLEGYGADIAECNYIITERDDEPLDANEIADVHEYTAVEAMKEHIADKAFRQSVVNKLYRRKVLESVRFTEGKMIDDEFFTYRAIGNAKKLVHSDKVMYAYRQQIDSVMHRVFSLKRIQAVEAKRERLEYVTKAFPSLASDARIDLWLTCLYQGQNAMRKLDKEDCKKAFEYLSDTVNKYPLTKTDLSTLSLQYKVWAFMTKVSLKLVCRTRNLIGIGL